jgi:anthranilate phosphoribosyltransferase
MKIHVLFDTILFYIYDITTDCIGETPKELCGMVRSMKKNSKPVEIPGFKCLDIVGMRYR